MRQIRLFILCMLLAFKGVAQGVQIQGKVTTANGLGIPRATILEQGTTNGATTNSEGEYKITTTKTNPTLVFSYVGLISQTINSQGRKTIDVTLEEDLKALQEVVVVGYGSQRKQDITSAVSVINMKDIGEQPANNMNQLLQGRAAGVVVKQKSGTPGGILKYGYGV